MNNGIRTPDKPSNVIIIHIIALAVWVAIALVAATSPDSFAQGAQTGIFVGPPVPIEGKPYTIRVFGQTSNPPTTVENIAIEVNGGFIDVTFFLNHGSSFPSMDVYEGTVNGPALPAGEYVVRQYTRQRYFGEGGYSQPGMPRYTLPFVIASPGAVGSAVEYFHAVFKHYFTTAEPSELAALDQGLFAGWARTGEVFHGVYLADPSVNQTVTPVSPVCRYYGLPSAGLNTHFFSGFPYECAVIPQLWPNVWILETAHAFFVFLPSAGNGKCPDGTIPLYRLFNGKADVNHRYTTSLTIRQQMINEYWISEGYGPDGVAMCISGS